MLREVGLSSLTDWLVNMIQSGASQDEVMAQLYDQQAFKDRFKGYFMLRDRNLPVPSIDEMLDYERTMFSVALQWRIPITIDEVQLMIGNGVSAREGNERCEMAANTVYHSPRETLQQLYSLYGIDEG